MSMESDLVALLKTLCPRVFPDVAPEAAAKPYITWQGLGGETARFVDNTAADKRNTMMQVNGWSTTRAEALDMIRRIEDYMCASAAFLAEPGSEALTTYETETQLYGCIQSYSIWAAR